LEEVIGSLIHSNDTHAMLAGSTFGTERGPHCFCFATTNIIMAHRSSAGAARPPASLNNAVLRRSKAPQLMAHDLIDNLVPRVGPFNPQNLHSQLCADHPCFADFPFGAARFRSRVNGLRKIINKSMHWAKFDDGALEHDLALHPEAERDPRGCLRWGGSEAQRLLAIDN